VSENGLQAFITVSLTTLTINFKFCNKLCSVIQHILKQLSLGAVCQFTHVLDGIEVLTMFFIACLE
jgi:hypothetical protein